VCYLKISFIRLKLKLENESENVSVPKLSPSPVDLSQRKESKAGKHPALLENLINVLPRPLFTGDPKAWHPMGAKKRRK
jgi:hypothetical protein